MTWGQQSWLTSLEKGSRGVQARIYKLFCFVHCGTFECVVCGVGLQSGFNSPCPLDPEMIQHRRQALFPFHIHLNQHLICFHEEKVSGFYQPFRLFHLYHYMLANQSGYLKTNSIVISQTHTTMYSLIL